MIHIGELIRRELIKQHHSATWFAKEMAFSRTSIYKLFDKPSIDTDILIRISIVLKTDFFKVYSQELEKIKNNVNG